MSSAENFEIRPVHVLRHRFEMSSKLTQKAMEILRLESDKLQVFGTRRVSLLGSDYYASKFDTKITRAAEVFRSYIYPIGLNGKMSIHPGDRGWSYVAMQVDRQQEFDILLSGLDSLPDLKVDKVLTDHYLTFRVASNGLLQSVEGRNEAVVDFQQATQDSDLSRLYSVAPLDITGYDSMMAFPIEGESDVLQSAS